MCGKFLTLAFVIIAIIMGILAVVMPPEHIDFVIIVAKFFDVMLPVLAVGALFKYLCRCTSCDNKCTCCNK